MKLRTKVQRLLDERDELRKMIVDILRLGGEIIDGFDGNVYRIMACHLFDVYNADWIDTIEVEDTPAWISACNANAEIKATNSARKWSAAWKAAAKKWFGRGVIAEALVILSELRIARLIDERDEARQLCRRLFRDNINQAEEIERLRSELNAIVTTLNEWKIDPYTTEVHTGYPPGQRKLGAAERVRNACQVVSYYQDELRAANAELAALKAADEAPALPPGGACIHCGRPKSEHEDDGEHSLCPPDDTPGFSWPRCPRCDSLLKARGTSAYLVCPKCNPSLSLEDDTPEAVQVCPP